MYPRLMKKEKPTERAPKGKPIWCPFCQQWTKFVKSGNGYKVTECCGYSDVDFWIRTYNPHLWGLGSKRKK